MPRQTRQRFAKCKSPYGGGAHTSSSLSTSSEPPLTPPKVSLRRNLPGLQVSEAERRFEAKRHDDLFDRSTTDRTTSNDDSDGSSSHTSALRPRKRSLRIEIPDEAKIHHPFFGSNSHWEYETEFNDAVDALDVAALKEIFARATLQVKLQQTHLAVQSSQLESLRDMAKNLEISHESTCAKLGVAEAKFASMEGRLQDALNENDKLLRRLDVCGYLETGLRSGEIDFGAAMRCRVVLPSRRICL